ncbi:hypothetical protein ACJQWK_10189 [Exserohilum turcicum]|uniref:Uncharacterized protein n=1 Tax=Exserohilum turcicum (strain 28A) TaxID=671987 RepID=R0KDS2_EXST2|nr:uncharacterized protein SETTUDRAFT_163402 [Exserohilum turcica Et28A]EOA87489.1 hypothetical protein SETTUDRAFT_163402 [Exserohilum turcica Et28A]
MAQEGSASPAWRLQSLAGTHDAPPAAHDGPRPGPADDDDDNLEDLDEDDHRHIPHTYRPVHPPRRMSAFESALRAARSPAGRASSRSSRLHRRLPRISHVTARYPGDGFDFRRPAGSSRERNVRPVDLTGEDEDAAVDLSGDNDHDHDHDHNHNNDNNNDNNNGDNNDNNNGNNNDNSNGNDEFVIDLTADDSGYGASQDEHNGRQQHAHADQHDPGRGRANHGAPRLPRGMDIIIDLDNGEEEWRMATPAPEPSSPDIEFISSRTIDPRRLPRPNQAGNTSDGDEVEFLRENALPEAEIRRRRNRELDNVLNLFGTLNGRFTHLRAQVDRFNTQINRTAGRFHEPIPPTRNPSRGHAHIRLGAFVAPVMDFNTIGFDLGSRTREPPAPPPTYDAPPKAPEGFTRSPEEEGALVCPNCEEELCVGSDEVKRQVWIVKGCGHVYCGECTANRAAKRSAKGKERPASTNPFKTCVVEGCDKNVSNKKSMIQVFL